jgi:hypothetical protein
MAAPASRIGPLEDAERSQLLKTSIVAGIYDTTQDQESAYEVLRARTAAAAATVPAQGKPTAAGRRGGSQTTGAPAEDAGWAGTLKDSLGGLLSGSGRKDSVIETAAKSAARSVGSSLGRAIIRGVLGSILKGK